MRTGARALVAVLGALLIVGLAGCRGEVAIDVRLGSGERGVATVTFGIDGQLAADPGVRQRFDALGGFGAADGWRTEPVAPSDDGWTRIRATHPFDGFDELEALLTRPYPDLLDQPLVSDLRVTRASGFLHTRYRVEMTVDHSTLAQGLIATGQDLYRSQGQPQAFVDAVPAAVVESLVVRHSVDLPGTVSERTGVDPAGPGNPPNVLSFAPPVTDRASFAGASSRLNWANVNGLILAAALLLTVVLFGARAGRTRRDRRRTAAGG